MLPLEQFHHLHKMMTRYLQRYMPQHEAEDLVQDVWLKALEEPRLEKSDSWYWRVLKNKMVDLFRKGKVQAWTLPDPNITAFEEQVISWLEPLSHTLPATYREAILGHDFRGHPMAKLAKDAHISVSGMKSRVQRARKLLASALLDRCDFEMKGNQPLSCSAKKTACC